jgi:NADH dehydrogenase
MTRTSAHRVVIVGGGFGGLHAAQCLRRAAVELTLIDRRNFHLFQPLLYQVATGTLSPADIASPLRYVLRRQRNVEVLLGEVTSLDAAGKRVLMGDVEVPYDTLILATGASHNYFGHDEWSDVAPGLKTIEDATRIRQRILSAFEVAERAAERRAGPEQLRALLTFVVVGAGPTGVELAGALAEIAKNTLRGEFKHINPASARVLLVEGTQRILGTFAPNLSARAEAALERLGIEVRKGWRVVDVSRGRVVLESGPAPGPGGPGQDNGQAPQREEIQAFTVLWGAGVQASPLGAALARATGVKLDRAGRVFTEPDCSVSGHPEIFVLGDLCHFVQDGKPLPWVAQTAIQQGRFVARVIRDRLKGRTPPREFRYFDLGNMATVGRGVALVERGRLRMAGFFAWLAWLLVHLMNLVEFENRLLVFLQWAWSFLTWNRSARLITGESAPPPANASPVDRLPPPRPRAPAPSLPPGPPSPSSPPGSA